MAADPTPPRFIIEINTTGFGMINGRWYQWRYHWHKKKYWWRWRGHPRLLPRGDHSPLFLFFTWRRQYSRLLFSNFLVGSLALTQALSFHTHYKSGVIHVVEYELRSVAFCFGFHNCPIFFYPGSETGFFRRFCHSKIMLLCVHCSLLILHTH